MCKRNTAFSCCQGQHDKAAKTLIGTWKSRLHNWIFGGTSRNNSAWLLYLLQLSVYLCPLPSIHPSIHPYVIMSIYLLQLWMNQWAIKVRFAGCRLPGTLGTWYKHEQYLAVASWEKYISRVGTRSKLQRKDWWMFPCISCLSQSLP
jgi:hypothetical protein